SVLRFLSSTNLSSICDFDSPLIIIYYEGTAYLLSINSVGEGVGTYFLHFFKLCRPSPKKPFILSHLL
ncbi:MAG: hypothetical protein NTV72_01170, partial [Candidatus Taylorbacteria bacterium]|nr:hypothetical protein [Candidatus Taylorbacteria bacterium]